MIGIGIGAVALLLLLLQLAEMYLQNIKQQELMKTKTLEVEVRWISRPEKYRKIEPDWNRILDSTEVRSDNDRKYALQQTEK